MSKDKIHMKAADTGSYIEPPKSIPLYLRPLIYITEKTTGKTMLPARLLTWRPVAGIASGLLELSAEKGGKQIGERITALIRLIISFEISSPFLIDINAQNREKYHITSDEMSVLRGEKSLDSSNSFTEREGVALRYALMLSKTPIQVDNDLILDVKRLFSQEEMVIMAVLVGKVNYWGRFAEGLGIPPAGYNSADDPELKL